MKSIFLSFFLFFVSISAFAQEYLENKHFKKMAGYYQKEEYSKAVEEMRYVLDQYGDDPKVWEIAISLYFKRYLATPDDDALVKQLNQALKNTKTDGQPIALQVSSPRDRALRDVINICREASLKTRDNVSSMYLRVLLIDKQIDTAVTEKANAYRMEAEQHFQSKNFNKALESYEKAIQEYPNFYKATLYKGDTYYHLKDYKNAALYYKKAEAMAPDQLEPVKYLTDAYGRDRLLDEAMNSCIRGITIYPDVSMFAKLDDIAEAQGKKTVDPWLRRKCYPNLSFYSTSPTTDPTWKAYQDAKLKIQSFCDSSGAIVVKNDLTKQQYMETYCWEEMLKTTTDQQFDFAKKMQAEGYLDCYVFITMYHYDIHKQYKQFAFNNDQRIKTYITKYLVTQ